MESGTVTLDQVEGLAIKLHPKDQLKLVARICEQLNLTLPNPLGQKNPDEQTWQERLRLADELLAECEGIIDDSHGSTDAAALIRGMRDERIAQIWQKNA